jgi:hypothetical protein
MKRNYVALRALLWVIGLYHITFGLLANLPAETMRQLAATLLGFKLPAEPVVDYIVQPFGIYVIVFGVMMTVAAWNPVKNRALISVGVVLFVLRIIQRLASFDDMQRAFGVTPARNLFTVSVVALFAAALIWLRYQLYRDMHRTDSTAAGAGSGA